MMRHGSSAPETGARKLLHVGCGLKTIRQTTPGFQSGAWHEVRLDINPDVKPDVIGTMTDMPLVQDESVDAVYSSHNIEHLYIHEVPTALKEFLRVLKPDGFVVLKCPDLQAIVPQILDGGLHKPLYDSGIGPVSPHDILYGHGRTMAQGNLYWAHKCGFTLQTLAQQIVKAGFGITQGLRTPDSYELHMIASKPKIDEAAMTELARTYMV